MKNRFPVTLLLSVSLTCGSFAAESPKKPDREQIKNETVGFFTRRLSGEKECCKDNSRIKPADVEKERRLVWDAWKTVNDNFREEKLIPLEDLSKRNTGLWRLPHDLEADAAMPYYWGSKGEKPADGFPLYLYLHGSGTKEHEWESGIRMSQTFDDSPSVYFIPRIPREDHYRWYPRSKQYAWEKLLRLAFVSGEADPGRVYFFGISEGGYGSQRLASFYADYLAGAGPMAGGEPLKNAPAENCRNIAFSLRTGANDIGFYRNTLTGYTADEFDRLSAEFPGSFIHEIELIPGRGHSIDYSVTTPWLKQYTRNPYPKFVSWENFEMDGRYRDGFYNIAVDERSNTDESERTYYELAIDGNDISLKVELVSYQTIEKDQKWGIEMKFEKHYTPAAKGRITLYLCEELVDMGKKITVTVNGRKAFRGRVKPERRHIINSCAVFFDPARLYPAAIEIDLSELQR